MLSENLFIINSIGIIACLIITCLFKYKNPLQYYVKFCIFFLIVFFFSNFIIPFALLRPRDARNIKWYSAGYKKLFKIFSHNVTLENGQYLKLGRPCIVICNHQCAIDFITMMKIWPGGNLSPLAKKELLYGTASFGYCIWLLGITFIDRLNSEKSHKTIDALAENMEKSQMSVWIYPEGTRNTKLELLPLKKGAFFLAIKAGVPIVSIVTSSYLNFFCKKENKWLPNGQVKVRVLPPVETKGMSIESVGDLANDLRERMQKEFELLNKEINLDEKYYKQK